METFKTFFLDNPFSHRNSKKIFCFNEHFFSNKNVKPKYFFFEIKFPFKKNYFNWRWINLSASDLLLAKMPEKYYFNINVNNSKYFGFSDDQFKNRTVMQEFTLKWLFRPLLYHQNKILTFLNKTAKKEIPNLNSYWNPAYDDLVDSKYFDKEHINISRLDFEGIYFGLTDFKPKKNKIEPSDFFLFINPKELHNFRFKDKDPIFIFLKNINSQNSNNVQNFFSKETCKIWHTSDDLVVSTFLNDHGFQILEFYNSYKNEYVKKIFEEYMAYYLSFSEEIDHNH